MNLKSLFLLLALATVGCYAETSSTGQVEEKPAAPVAADMNSAPSKVMQVSGMSCGGCASSIVKKLEALDEIAAAKADAETGRVEVHFAAEKSCGEEALTSAIADAGEQFTVDSIE